MSKLIKTSVVVVVSIATVIMLCRMLFIKTVNYSIAGITIPARYNVLTGKAVPIADYKGKKLKATVMDVKSNRLGLDSDDIIAARFRWELFEEWVKGKPQYKGWAQDPDVFKKANEDFINTVHPSVKVIK